MTDGRLIELRDAIDARELETKQFRQEQLRLIPKAKAARASTTELAARLGISRAAFYKNRYSEIPADSSGDPGGRDDVLDQISALSASYFNSENELKQLRQERDQAILEELQRGESTWVQISQQAGVSQEWLSRIKSGS